MRYVSVVSKQRKCFSNVKLMQNTHWFLNTNFAARSQMRSLFGRTDSQLGPPGLCRSDWPKCRADDGLQMSWLDQHDTPIIFCFEGIPKFQQLTLRNRLLVVCTNDCVALPTSVDFYTFILYILMWKSHKSFKNKKPEMKMKDINSNNYDNI